jgi:hypothetical protein
MKHKTLFRLGLKLMGVLSFGLGLGWLAMGAGYLLLRWQSQMMGFWEMSVPPMLMGVVQLGFGLYLFFRGDWIVNLAIPSNRPYCPECAYDLSGAATTRCPECGTPFRWEDVLPAGSKEKELAETGQDGPNDTKPT